MLILRALRSGELGPGSIVRSIVKGSQFLEIRRTILLVESMLQSSMEKSALRLAHQPLFLADVLCSNT